ncbi:hypothetical protein BU16DRAFT_92941 [Lophium mytilinum]|uniref:Uncharacterized protein n=1 Tax=Lophium mytilinum TaxID=390894 RepID=A0A6A6QKR4_9PEZI|nr:hypothetical protein BU16DRAFT_92941 [Lophium mytilinum]
MPLPINPPGTPWTRMLPEPVPIRNAPRRQQAGRLTGLFRDREQIFQGLLSHTRREFTTNQTPRELGGDEGFRPDKENKGFRPPAWLVPEDSERPWEMGPLVLTLLREDGVTPATVDIDAGESTTHGPEVESSAECDLEYSNSISHAEVEVTELEEAYIELGVMYHQTTDAARNTSLSREQRRTLSTAFSGQPRSAHPLFEPLRRAQSLYNEAHHAHHEADMSEEHRARLGDLLTRGSQEVQVFREEIIALHQLVTSIRDADAALAFGGRDPLLHRRAMMARHRPDEYLADPRIRAWVMALPETARQLELGVPLAHVIIRVFEPGDGPAVDDVHVWRGQDSPPIPRSHESTSEDSESDTHESMESDSDDSMDSL